MKRIGLVGEDPNDTLSIKALMLQKYAEQYEFRPLIRNVVGGGLDSARVAKALQLEVKDYNPHMVIFIRDADCIASEAQKIKKVTKWFDELNKAIGNKGILLLNIYELEAIILADVATFNRLYRVTIPRPGNVMFIHEPKEYLKRRTRSGKKVYTESHCPKLFAELSYDTIIKNCQYFADFELEFLGEKGNSKKQGGHYKRARKK